MKDKQDQTTEVPSLPPEVTGYLLSFLQRDLRKTEQVDDPVIQEESQRQLDLSRQFYIPTYESHFDPKRVAAWMKYASHRGLCTLYSSANLLFSEDKKANGCYKITMKLSDIFDGDTLVSSPVREGEAIDGIFSCQLIISVAQIESYHQKSGDNNLEYQNPHFGKTRFNQYPFFNTYGSIENPFVSSTSESETKTLST